jgi:hypothetical protein
VPSAPLYQFSGTSPFSTMRHVMIDPALYWARPAVFAEGAGVSLRAGMPRDHAAMGKGALPAQIQPRRPPAPPPRSLARETKSFGGETLARSATCGPGGPRRGSALGAPRIVHLTARPRRAGQREDSIGFSGMVSRGGGGAVRRALCPDSAERVADRGLTVCSGGRRISPARRTRDRRPSAPTCGLAARRPNSQLASLRGPPDGPAGPMATGRHCMLCLLLCVDAR